MLSIIYHLPNWIQALAAAALVGLTWRTLLVLREYAKDTKTIANKSIEQIEIAQKPFLALVLKPENIVARFPGGWVIENQGFGAALNIRHSQLQDADGWVNITPIAKSDFHVLTAFDENGMRARNRVFTIEYESLSGIKYATVVDWQHGVMRARFEGRK
jgi:hypothetical protein